MFFIGAMLLIAFGLSRRGVRKALPFPSLLAFGLVVLTLATLFQADRLG